MVCQKKYNLDQNLGRNLIRIEVEKEGISSFAVNFTTDLSDTFAEVVNMERIGFKVFHNNIF